MDTRQFLTESAKYFGRLPPNLLPRLQTNSEAGDRSPASGWAVPQASHQRVVVPGWAVWGGTTTGSTGGR